MLDWLKKLIGKDEPSQEGGYNPITSWKELERRTLVEHGYFHHILMSFADQPSSGWKVAISVDNGQVKEAYELLAPHLFNAGISSKVVLPHALKKEAWGKVFTLYLRDDQHPETILNEIFIKLKGVTIRPGPTTEAMELNRRISDYFYVRHDNDIGGRNYVAAINAVNTALEQRKKGNLLAEPYNPMGFYDPFIGILVGETLMRPSRAVEEMSGRTQESVFKIMSSLKSLDRSKTPFEHAQDAGMTLDDFVVNKIKEHSTGQWQRQATTRLLRVDMDERGRGNR